MVKKKRFKKGGWVDPKSLPLTQDGFTACRWCKGNVQPPRRTFCSASCVHEHRLRTSGTYVRDCVYKRDKAVCWLCGLDTKKIAREAKKIRGKVRLKRFLEEHEIPTHRKVWKGKWGGGLWDADHVNPVYSGGGQCGLDNYRTVCIPCHRDITSAQATQRAADRKKKKQDLVSCMKECKVDD